MRRLVSRRYPFVDVRVEVQGQAIEFSALLDTGFDGAVVLPGGRLAANASPDGTTRWMMANGMIVQAPIYHASLTLGPFAPMPGELSIMGRVPLLGRAVLGRFTVVLEHGQRVTIQE